MPTIYVKNITHNESSKTKMMDLCPKRRSCVRGESNIGISGPTGSVFFGKIRKIVMPSSDATRVNNVTNSELSEEGRKTGQ